MSADTDGGRWAHERLLRLSEAGTRIGTTLDVMRTAQELADFTVPLVADFVTVDLAETVPLGLEPLSRLGQADDGEAVFRRAGVASIREGMPEAIWTRGDPVFVPPGSPFTVIISSGRSHLEPHLDIEAWATHDAERAKKMRRTGMHSLIVVPIHARGVVLGTVTFLRTDNPDPFEETDLLLAEDIVSRAALSLDNARRYTRERTVALALQRSLLPSGLDGGTAVDVASRYRPADAESGVGGDWFDVLPLSGARVALVVGDVVGHGIHAAATMGRLRTAVQTLADMDLPPEELLTHLDDLVHRLVEEDHSSQEQPPTIAGATCLYVIYDPVSRCCSMARAGHPPPAIVAPGGRVSYPEIPAGAPLGLGPVRSLPYASAELTLPEGSLIALYTDGLVESRFDDIDVGMERLATALGQPGLSLEELCSAAVATLPADDRPDDMALLLARTHVLKPARTASWVLPADPSFVSRARSLTTHQLNAWGLEDLGPTTELVVSELVTNAILHGSGTVRLRLIRDHALICEVSDTSNSFPRPRRAGSTDEGGRGLLLVARLCGRWGSRYTADGKLVWAEQDLPRAA